MKNIAIGLAALALAALPCAGSGAGAAPAGRSGPPWKTPGYSLVARDMDLRAALNSFAVSQGLPAVMSESVRGVFSGDFRDLPPQEFLDRIAAAYNLTWYYDGAALYVYGAGEVSTVLIELKYMKAGELRAMLAELGVEDARFPLKTASNDELIMVSGAPRYVALVAETISRADKLREMRTFNEVEVRMFPLVNTWADDVSFKVASPESSVTIKGVARLLEEMMNGTNTGKTRETVTTNGTDEAAGSMQEGAFRPVIRPENRLNAVLVRDVKSRMPMYETLVKQLDVPQKLVEIAVTVVELNRQDALDWQLSLALSTAHGHSGIGAGQNAGNLFDPAEIAGRGLAGALTHIHSSYALASSITALREKGKARNMSRTTLLTVNNLAAQMTDTQSYHARVVGTEVANLEEVSAGTKLQVKPRIVQPADTNMPAQVWLSLELTDGGFESVTVDAMPMTRSSTLQTQTAVLADESIMLAGYLRDIEESAGWGIPWLRDIPWIGWLFGGKSTRTETVQRMFILTPHIVDLDADTLARLQATRLRDLSTEESLADDAEEDGLERAIREELRNEKNADRKLELEMRLKDLREMRKERELARMEARERAEEARRARSKERLEAERERRKREEAEREKARKAQEEKERKAREEKARKNLEEGKAQKARGEKESGGGWLWW